MSEAFIKKLAADVVQHPAFVRAMQIAVTDVLTSTLQSGHAGQELRLYVPKFGKEQRAQRAILIRSQYTGDNCAALAEAHGLSIRHIRRIVK